MKAKTADLIYGAVIDGGKLLHPRDTLTTYELDLLEPVDGITRIAFTAPTLGETLQGFEAALKRHQPGTPAYLNAAYRVRIERVCDPAPSKEQMDRMSGVDHDAIMALVNQGLTPDGRRPFRVRDEHAENLRRTATLRLHFMNDRKIADQRLTTSREENPLAAEAILAWLVTRFEVQGEEAFSAREMEYEQFLNLPWSDFVVLQAALNARDYQELSDILDGEVMLDGRSVPFPGVPDDDEPSNDAKGKRKRPLAS